VGSNPGGTDLISDMAISFGLILLSKAFSMRSA
jgi:hypothetical protein